MLTSDEACLHNLLTTLVPVIFILMDWAELREGEQSCNQTLQGLELTYGINVTLLMGSRTEKVVSDGQMGLP